MKSLAYGPDPSQVLDVYLPKQESFDVLIYFHGGGFNSGDKGEAAVLADYLTGKGIAVISANYRMYPNAVFPQFVEDAAEAVHWALVHGKEYGTCKRFFVGGSSAGGYLSMMLCFDTHYLKAHGVEPGQISGYIHDAGQPTAHFNILRERGLDFRRVIVDETAPLYFVGLEKEYPPMEFVLSEHDLPCRYEQTLLMIAAIRDFVGSSDKVSLTVLPGKHYQYVGATDEQGDSILGKQICSFMEKYSSAKEIKEVTNGRII